jgi:superfamily II DNA or RNA helicase
MDFFNFSPSVEKVGSYYVVTGINLNALETDLRTNFGTSVIFNRIISKVNNRRFRIHQFFIIELAWILDHFTTNKNKRQVDRYRVGMYKYKALFDEIKAKTWIKTTFETFAPYNVDKALKKFRLTPYMDQREFLEDYSRIKYGYQLRGCLLDAEPGSGKTFTSLVWSEMISPYKTIIVVPKHLVNTPWVDEMTNKYFKVVPKIWTSLDGTNPLNHTDCDYFIIYKENLRSGEYDPLINAISKNGKEPVKIIVDESHNYNESKSQQSQGLIQLGSHPFVSDVLFMSGTPIKAQGRETFVLFKVIDKYFDNYVQDDFNKMYGRDNAFLNEMLAHRLGRIKYTITSVNGMGKPPEPITWPVSFPGAEKYTLNSIRAEMMDFIQERVSFYHKVMPQYLQDWYKFVDNYRGWIRGDALEEAELKQYVDTVEYFRKFGYNNFTDADKSKFCRKVETKIENELRGDDLKYFRNIKSAVKYLSLKIRGEALGRVLSRARMDAVRDTIQHAKLPELINAVKKKTVIYTSYIETVNELVAYFASIGMKALAVHGENSKDIDKIVTQFRDDKDVQVLITTYNTLKEGYPLTMANQIICMNAPFRSYEMKQTIARIYRNGQDTECFVYLLDLDTGNEENITSRSIDIMEWSKEQVDVLLGGGKLPTNINGISLAVKGMWGMGFAGFEHYYDMVPSGAEAIEPSIPELLHHINHQVQFRKATANDLF